MGFGLCGLCVFFFRGAPVECLLCVAPQLGNGRRLGLAPIVDVTVKAVGRSVRLPLHALLQFPEQPLRDCEAMQPFLLLPRRRTKAGAMQVVRDDDRLNRRPARIVVHDVGNAIDGPGRRRIQAAARREREEGEEEGEAFHRVEEVEKVEGVEGVEGERVKLRGGACGIVHQLSMSINRQCHQ